MNDFDKTIKQAKKVLDSWSSNKRKNMLEVVKKKNQNREKETKESNNG